VYRADSPVIDQRVTQEYDAGRFNVDVIENASDNMLTLAKYLQAYKSPSTADYPAASLQPAGLWAPHWVNFVAVGANTSLIQSVGAPKTWDDLLDPKYQGMMGLSAGGQAWNWIEGIYELKGNEQARQYFTQLKRQNVRQWGVAIPGILDLMGSGQLALSPAISPALVEQRKPTGTPIDWLPVAPIFVFPSVTTLAKNAPHPNASMLWIDFVLSKAGQETLAGLGYVPTHPQVPGTWPAIKQTDWHYLDPEAKAARLPEVQQIEQQTFQQAG
jgi:iron(III) transport system substrate-binding protein